MGNTSRAFWGSTSFNRGVVGNYLSHIRIWEQILERNIRFAIVCEDDGVPLIPLPRTEAGFHLPSEFDLVFLNQRAAAWLDPVAPSLYHRDLPFSYVPFEDAVGCLMEHHPRLEAPSAEGYAVSLKGAKALLKMASSAGICSGDDWAMTVHSLTARFREGLMKSLPSEQQREIASLNISDVHLRTFVLLPGLVDHRDGGSPTIPRKGPTSRIERSAMGF